jgi:hypothetical protein
MKNENGFAIVIAIGVLGLLTIIGVSALQISITEVKISANEYIYYKNFYAAESGPAYGPVWLADVDEDGNPNLPESEYTNVDWEAVLDIPIGKINHLNAVIRHRTAIDPDDGIEKVLLYGDGDGDYLNEVNFDKGVPLAIITSTGTCTTRSGKAVIESTHQWQSLFVMPGAALRVYSNVNGNGVSGSIIGEHKSGSSCDDIADIMYDVAGGTIEYGGNLGVTPVIEESGGMYPMSIIDPIIRMNATQTIIGSMNIDESLIVTDADNPGIIFIDGSGKTTNLTGYGVLFVNGDFEFGGNLDWNGFIMVNGNITLSGGGSKIINGAVVAAGDAEAVNGSVDIQYDCDLLNDLNNMHSKYRMTSWKHP